MQLINNLLGKPIYSEDVQCFLKMFNLPSSKEQIASYLTKTISVNNSPNFFIDSSGNILDAVINDFKRGIFITFRGYIRYKQEFGEPKYISITNTDELILNVITFDSNSIQTFEDLNIELPFNIKFKDPIEIINSKIGVKPKQKSKGVGYKQAVWFYFEEYKILTALDDNLELMFIRFMEVSLDEKKTVQLESFLKQQNKNINPQNHKNVESYIDSLPTKKWERRRKDGDKMFSKQNIIDVECLLKEYIVNLSALTQQKKAKAIYLLTKKLIMSINKYHNKSNTFIETEEREELATFINDIIRLTGFEFDDNLDITEQWREW